MSKPRREPAHHEPITGRVVDVRPPYDRRDPVMDQDIHGGESTESWRERVHADRLAVLLAQMPADLTDREREHLEWLVGWEDTHVAVMASLMYRAREEGRRQGATETLRAEGEFLKKKAGEVDNDSTTARKALSTAGNSMVRRAERKAGKGK